MKISAWIENRLTRRSRARRTLIMAAKQGPAAIAILCLKWGRVVVYEVYNSEHYGEAPMMWETFREALGYAFPRREMTPYQERLREQAKLNYQEIVALDAASLGRYEPASGHNDALEKLAIERLAGSGTERGTALAMEIERGRERRRDRLR
jgi:hypothetical protein